MKDYSVPFTQKFPRMYIIELRGYSIRTTNETRHNNLLAYLKQYCNDDSYADLPFSKRMDIECNFDVVKINNF